MSSYTQPSKKSGYASGGNTTTDSYGTPVVAQESLPLYIINNVERKGGVCTCQKKGPCRGTCLG